MKLEEDSAAADCRQGTALAEDSAAGVDHHRQGMALLVEPLVEPLVLLCWGLDWLVENK